MKDLSRKEELILEAICKIEDEPYGLNIRRSLFQLTGKTWPIGSLYFYLDRLEKKGLLKSSPLQPSRDRGNLSKRLYDFTNEGSEKLKNILVQKQNTKEI
ncbi:MAG: PadR family transcriptional regulator [Candidatus Aminicenantes bacterium]|nr:PadR family transcriptional regulator [Candidatus Aminicenantes bacterium]